MQENSKLEYELHAYVDGDLDEEAMARVEAYLRKNPDAAAKVRDYLRQTEDIRNIARRETSHESAPAINALGKRLAKRLKHGGLFGPQRALVMTILFAAGWLGHMLYVPLVEGPRFANEIVQAHLLTSSDPSEVIPISPGRISKLYSRIGEIQKLPDLRQFGYQPIGAQLLPSDEGIVLHIPYRNNQNDTTISYFLLHDDEEAEVPRHLLHREGVTMVYWQHEHSRHAITALLEDEELAGIAAYLDSTGAAVPSGESQFN